MRIIRNTKRSPPHMVKSYCKIVTEYKREHTCTDKSQLYSQTNVNCTHMDCKNKLVFFSFTGTCTFIFTVPKLQHIKNPEPRLHQTHFRLESKDSKSKAHTLLKKKKKSYDVKALILYRIIVQFSQILFFIFVSS